MVRELPDGSLQLVDGHLRAETTPDAEVPVLIVDLDDKEADKVLATFDPLGAMAEPDEAVLAELLKGIETDREALAAMLEQLSDDAGCGNIARRRCGACFIHGVDVRLPCVAGRGDPHH